MLLATRLSEAAKKPRLRLIARRSSSLSPSLRLPERDIGLHGNLSRHPVIVAGGEVLVPRPVVFQRQQLVHVGAAIDHALLVDGDAPERASRRGRIGIHCRSVRFGHVCPVKHSTLSPRAGYWQASQVGSSMEQACPQGAGKSEAAAAAATGAGAAAMGATATALSLPSVRLSVDFSTCVAERERR